MWSKISQKLRLFSATGHFAYSDMLEVAHVSLVVIFLQSGQYWNKVATSFRVEDSWHFMMCAQPPLGMLFD